MATKTTTLTQPGQSRKMHKVYRNGKLVRVYYTDNSDKSNSGGGTKTITSNRSYNGDAKRPRKAKIPWVPSQSMINEFRSYGRDFVQQKYRLTSAKLNQLADNINKAISGKTSPIAQDGFLAAAGRFKDGGPIAGSNPAFKRQLTLNLENDSDRAQGSHHDWAQPTSISSLITGQLRQAQNAPADYFEAWAQDKGGTTDLLARDSSSFGLDVNHVPDSSHDVLAPVGQQQTMAEDDPMGAFATPAVMDPFYAQQEDDHNHGTEADVMYANASSQLKNPWSEGYGGATNAYGPSAQTMAQATMEAMALANAYFAPQRMELAYQLGDMETDMRRLAVNLGRQVDDPVLQAKLYKEGMRAVRTMDVQQNTMAFQMAEQRRREELSNFQFYDNLAQQEYQLRLANQQFMSRLELDNAYFGLQKDQLNMAMDGANPPQADTSPAPGTNPPSQNPPPQQQVLTGYNPVQPTITGSGNLLKKYH